MLGVLIGFGVVAVVAAAIWFSCACYDRKVEKDL